MIICRKEKFKVLVRFAQPADALLQPGDELEEEVLRLHLEAWQGVRLVVVVEEVHLLLLERVKLGCSKGTCLEGWS